MTINGICIKFKNCLINLIFREFPMKRWRTVKSKIACCGIDDEGFNRNHNNNKPISVYGVIMKGSAYVDGILKTEIKRDDFDCTNKLIRMIKESNHYKQIRIIFLEGITIGGFLAACHSYR